MALSADGRATHGIAPHVLAKMRFELGAKREYLGILQAMGWNPDMLGQVRFFENAMVGAIAVPLGVLGALGIGLLLAPYAALWAGIAGLVAVLCWIPIATKVVQ